MPLFFSFDYQLGVSLSRSFTTPVSDTVQRTLTLTWRIICIDYAIHAPVLNSTASCILPTTLCRASHYDTFLLTTLFWSSLQLSWTVILLGAQLWQIGRQMTTLEVSNMGKYGFMGGRPAPVNQQGRTNSSATESLESSQDHVHGSNCDHSTSTSGGGGKRTKSTKSFLLKILGIDRFTSGHATKSLLAHSSLADNPFDLGLISNCNDFWSRGGRLGVDYERLYSIPVGGFNRHRGRGNMNYDRVEMEVV